MRALVVFCDPDDARWQWALKPGFRHVFCVIAGGDYWITVDARTAQSVIEVTSGTVYDLAAHYRAEGLTVVEWDGKQRPWRSPFATANCVGLTKAILGVRAWWAQTPYQLWKHLSKESRHAVHPARIRKSQGRHAATSASAPDH